MKNSFVSELFRSFLSILFPVTCAACGKPLVKGEKTLCMNCILALPQTNYYKQHDNKISKLFWGRVHVFEAFSIYHFEKSGYIQTLLHALKYRSREDVGTWFGQQAARVINKCPNLSSVEVVVPVPLHRSRRRQRGYNQSEVIAKAIVSQTNMVLDTKSLKRIAANKTQTKKGKYDRWKNVSTIFRLEPNHKLENKHILLIDDVITTGATAESCLAELWKANPASVSYLAIASA
jgi:ComF family protein